VARDLAPGVGDLLLVKGSRGIELDRLVAALTDGPGGHA
jgi:UDP-N-acetylmuramyl pentapeptide synthase